MYKLSVQVFMVVALLLAAGNLFAGENVISNITPPSKNEPVGNFDGNGILQLKDDDQVVIGDVRYRLGPEVSFRHYNGASSSSTDFPVGIRVWFVLYPDNTIKSLWKEGG